MLTMSADPKTYNQALKTPNSESWIEAMGRELDLLEQMGVWKEVVLLAGQHTLGKMWVYKRKTGASG